MKSTLVFYDNEENSKRGTLRGLAIFPIYIVLTLVWFLVTKPIYSKYIDKVSTFKIIFALLLSGVLMVSAIAVHTPDTVKKATVYGALVGFVVYGVSNAVLLATNDKWGFFISMMDISWGIANTALLSYLLYRIVKAYPTTFEVI